MPLRVISGSAGGLHLKAPKKQELRPTQDRIRQVIFSSLAELIPGSRVLDLYAGTGSFGIEALSRGAASATFVEQGRETVQCIRDNLAHCRLQKSAEVLQVDVAQFLKSPPAHGCYDLIFADPPYEKSVGRLETHPLLGLVLAHVEPNGFFVWEHYAQQTLTSHPSWVISRQRIYGETGLTFLNRADINSTMPLSKTPLPSDS